MNFFVRLASSAVLVIVLAVLCYFGGLALLLALALLSVLAFLELTRTFDTGKAAMSGDPGSRVIPPIRTQTSGLQIAGVVVIVAYYAALYAARFHSRVSVGIYGSVIAAVSIAGLFGLLMVLFVLTYPKYGAFRVASTFFSYCYGPLMFSFIYLLRTLPNGRDMVWLVFTASWACDSSAYAFGYVFGKHKLAGVLSPKKTIEGAVGGVLGSFAAGLILGMIMINHGTAEAGAAQTWILGGISAVGAVFSQIGDLGASAIKREFAIKDYGRLIPGHGGIMDRFDSVVFVAPFVYFIYWGVVNFI